jgi:hypothetical protein
VRNVCECFSDAGVGGRVEARKDQMYVWTMQDKVNEKEEEEEVRNEQLVEQRACLLATLSTWTLTGGESTCTGYAPERLFFHFSLCVSGLLAFALS